MIFYFSGTGNTRWAAKELAKATSERLLFMPEELKGNCTYELQANERVGFCFPVHGWQPPHIVRAFIRRLTFHPKPSQLTPPPYCYTLCTCGDNMGEAMTMLNRELLHTGLQAQSMVSLIMPESYVCLPFMYTDPPEKEQRKIAEARVRLAAFIDVVKRRQVNYVELVKGAIPRTYSYIIGSYFNAHMITDHKFTVDADVCTHCGRCAKVCPVGDIVFDQVPTWKKDSSCTCCLSCYHHCPVHAINYGRITRKRGQYYFSER